MCISLISKGKIPPSQGTHFLLSRSLIFKNILSIDDLLDTTYESDMDYYRTTDFEQLLFIDDKKDDCYAEWPKFSKKKL